MGLQRLFRSHRKGVAVFGLTIVLIISVMLYMTRYHWWRQIGSATVTYEGRTLSDSKIYRSLTGDVLIYLEDLTDERQLYVVYVNEKRVGLPNHNHFIFLPGFAYSREIPIPLVFVGTAKAEGDPELVISESSIALNSRGGSRINITW